MCKSYNQYLVLYKFINKNLANIGFTEFDEIMKTLKILKGARHDKWSVSLLKIYELYELIKFFNIKESDLNTYNSLIKLIKEVQNNVKKSKQAKIELDNIKHNNNVINNAIRQFRNNKELFIKSISDHLPIATILNYK
jgi:hypothetical protein